MFEAALLRQAEVLLSLRYSCVFLDIFWLVNVMGYGASNQRVKGRCSRMMNDVLLLMLCFCYLFEFSMKHDNGILNHSE